jgi:two-component system LytT family sensor kinase
MNDWPKARGMAATVDFLKRERDAGSISRLLAPAIIGAFWVLHYLIYTAYALLNDSGAMLRQYLVPRAINSGFAIAISAAMVVILNKLRRRRLAFRAVTAVILTLIATGLHLAWVNVEYRLFFPGETSSTPLWIGFATDYLIRFWWFAALAAIILALSYVDDIREREERIGALQALAHDAQLRALRNQLNPHFLFNALNSIAGLISRRRDDEAESMTENLADFLRVTLALDPQKLITLAEETKLQEIYLEIEKVRFPQRLKVRLEIPAELEDVRVPSLITQPLIENSIKHAVARSTEPVELRISATAASKDLLSLVVEDSGGNADEISSKSAHLGIANVTERLKAHYGDAARLEVGPREMGGFRNTIVLPIRRL